MHRAGCRLQTIARLVGKACCPRQRRRQCETGTCRSRRATSQSRSRFVPMISAVGGRAWRLVSERTGSAPRAEPERKKRRARSRRTSARARPRDRAAVARHAAAGPKKEKKKKKKEKKKKEKKERKGPKEKKNRPPHTRSMRVDHHYRIPRSSPSPGLRISVTSRDSSSPRPPNALHQPEIPVPPAALGIAGHSAVTPSTAPIPRRKDRRILHRVGQ